MSRGVRKIPKNLRFPLIDPGAAFCPGAAWGARAGKERIQIRGAALQLIIRRVRRRLPGIHKHTAAALFCLKFFIGNFAAPILFFTELWYNIPVGKK